MKLIKLQKKKEKRSGW